MNAELLLQHFAKVAEAPDAVVRLRCFILDLAIRGQLVPQDANEEPASALLRRIRAERDLMASRREIAPPAVKASDTIQSHGKLGWASATLADVLLELQTGPFGSSLRQSDYELGGTPVINPASIQNGRIIPVVGMAVGPSTLERLASFRLKAGDIIMARRGEMGRCAAITSAEDGWLCGTGSLVLRFPKPISRRYMVLLIGSPQARSYLGGSAVGSTMQNLNQSVVLGMPAPLPPLPEQHRIVAKVDELMAICDRLEESRQHREATRDRLTAATLHRLNTAPDPDSLREPARFFINHLPTLTARPDQIKQIRQTILNLAVRGRLVPQDPNDQPIWRELAPTELSREVKSARATESAATGLEIEVPFELPPSWAWLKIGDVFDVTGGIQKTPARTPVNNPYPYVGVGNVQRGSLDLSRLATFELQPGELDRFRLLPGDILAVEGNGSPNEVGRCALWSGEVPDCVHQNHIIRCRPKRREIAPYALCYLNSPIGIATMKSLAVTSSGLYNLSVGKIREIAVAMPPLAEQSRIVAAIQQFASLCESLSQQVGVTQAASTDLLKQLIA